MEREKNPSWLPYGGMPAPTRGIVEALQTRLRKDPELNSGIFEQMQGLCVTWDFLKNVLQPMVKEFLRRPSDQLAMRAYKYLGDEHPTTLPGQRLQIWQITAYSASRVIADRFFPEVLANSETRFLLEPHSREVMEAGQVTNRFASIRMPRPDEHPHQHYPAMTPTVFPVPHTLRQRLLLDFVAYTAHKMRLQHRLTEPVVRVFLHKPDDILNPSSRSRRVRFCRCPKGVRSGLTHTFKLWDMTEKGHLAKFRIKRLRELVTTLGYYNGDYWLRYTCASDQNFYLIRDDSELRAALRDVENHGTGSDSDDFVLDVVDDPNSVPLEILERLLETNEDLGLDFEEVLAEATASL